MAAQTERMTILVTGGAGFIGSAVVRQLIDNSDHSVVNVDALRYSANLSALSSVAGSDRYRFVQQDVCERSSMEALLEDVQPDAVMHLAAETHVDRSIDDPEPFVTANVLGTYSLLQAVLGYFRGLNASRQSRFRYLQISTDEVYGALSSGGGAFSECSRYDPRSPYSASKAAADHLANAWFHTYGLPLLLTNCSNNYGPFQYPEKLIPLVIGKALAAEPIPVYGRGDNVRDWLYVEDHARALLRVLEQAEPGASYNIGGRAERSNLDLVRQICRVIDELQPDASVGSREELIQFVEDRPGHDFRYAIDPSRIEQDLGWHAQESLDSGLRKTVQWYLSRPDWFRDQQAIRRRGLGS